MPAQAQTCHSPENPRPENAALQDILRLAGRAPRYTSYPTAVQFSPAVDETVYRGWLAALPPEEPVSLYLHLPFCDRLCWFCGCHTTVVHQRGPVEAYVALLVREMALVAAAIGHRQPVAAVHIGGGTPNLLAAHDLDDLLDALHRHFAPVAGFTLAMELDPRLLTPDWIAMAAARGLSRASLGVQDNDPAVQKAINRIQPWARTRAGIEGLRDAGIGSINLDLVYGLPHQSVSGLLATVDAAADAAPERMALFGYAHVPWLKPAQALIPDAALPGADERLRQQDAAGRRLEARGYRRIGLDHFALPGDGLARALDEGRLRRNFQGYTDDPHPLLIGLGASSIGFAGAGYAQNHARVPPWSEAVLAGRLPVARGVALAGEDRARAAIIERLMCEGSADLGPHGGRARFAAEHARLAGEDWNGLVRWDGDRLAVMPAGRPLLRAVASVFDAWFKPEAGRHSATV